MENDVLIARQSMTLVQALSDPRKFWRSFWLKCAMASLAEARCMFARGDDIGTLVGIHMIQKAEEARSAARSGIGTWSCVPRDAVQP